MDTLRKRLIALAAVAVLIAVGAIINTHQATAAAGPSVTIDGPLPLPVTGTVAATQTGAWNVGINGTPTVSISGTPTVGVNTTSTTPIFVDADRPARDGFNSSCFTGNVDPMFGQASCTLFTIPPGREVVIETISCQAELYAGDGPGDVQMIVPSPPVAGTPDHVSHLLTLTKQAGNSAVDIWRMTTQLRAYGSAPAGGSVDIGLFFRADPSRPNPQGISCTISGYLVGQ